MVEPISIGAGIITSDVIKRISDRFDNTDKEIAQALNDNDIEEALRLANEDKGTLETLFTTIRESALREDMNEEKVEQELSLMREYTQKEIAP